MCAHHASPTGAAGASSARPVAHACSTPTSIAVVMAVDTMPLVKGRGAHVGFQFGVVRGLQCGSRRDVRCGAPHTRRCRAQSATCGSATKTLLLVRVVGARGVAC